MMRMPTHDPRTVARENPGIFDSIFPQLTPGVVGHFNRRSEDWRSEDFVFEPVPFELIQATTLQKAMLFELGFSVGEALLLGKAVDWDQCVRVAVARQRRHFDAKIPDRIERADQDVAMLVGKNLEEMIKALSAASDSELIQAPVIPGFQWVASGSGDFAVGTTLIEVKCSNKNFSAADYRQIVMYWLLSFAGALEGTQVEWSEGVLLNPRLGRIVQFQFDELLHVISGGRSKVEILQLFQSMVGTRGAQ